MYPLIVNFAKFFALSRLIRDSEYQSCFLCATAGSILGHLGSELVYVKRVLLVPKIRELVQLEALVKAFLTSPRTFFSTRF